MISDHTLDQALVEMTRTLRAFKALRAARKSGDLPAGFSTCMHCYTANLPGIKSCVCCSATELSLVVYRSEVHAAALRASMDLSRKLSDLRQGR